MPKLIVMLTQNDRTAANACEIFERCKDSKAEFWGIKDGGLEPSKMKKLFGAIQNAGKTAVLEVVSYDEQSGLKAAKIAANSGCKMLLGTCFYPSILEFCKQENIKYLPFVGRVSGLPSLLSGGIDEIIKEAQECAKIGVWGIDLLAYRYEDGDPFLLAQKMLKSLDLPLVIAGSIDSYTRLDEIKKLNPQFFTIGSGFFEYKFGDDFASQIDAVCEYLEN